MPDSPIISQLKHGVELLEQGALDEAYQAFSALHKLDATQTDALYYLWLIDCQKSKYIEAESWARKLHQLNPNDAGALNLLGSALMHQEKYDAARDAFHEGIRLNDTDVALHTNLAICLCWEQKFSEAIDACRKALALKPDYVAAHNIMGNVWHGWRKPDRALECYRRAVQLDPQFIDAHMNIGRALHEMGQLKQALETYSKVIKSQPERADAWVRCGDIHRAWRDSDKAIEAYKVALEIAPESAAALTGLGNLVMRHRFYPQAEAHFRKALETEPASVEANLHLGVALRSQQKYKEAAESFRAVLQHAPGHFQATFFLAALEDTELPPKANPIYVRGLFDELADQYDQTQVGQLGYRVPEMLAEVIPQYITAENLTVIDLGCGTGLCGTLFRQYTAELTGVDISPHMIDKAEERKVYDKLIAGEIVEVLENANSTFNLVLAADVLIYLGDLIPLFRAVNNALKPGGVFAFSIELLNDADGMYALCPEARYVHSTGYVSALADGQNMEILHFKKQQIRKEHGQPVSGLIAVLQKPSS